MMNVQIDQLVRTLLQKDSIDACSLKELQDYAERHPYFGAAQLLLTKKLQKEDPSKYEEQLQKTYLFFHNPLWVEHLLNENGTATIVPGKQVQEDQATEIVKQQGEELSTAVEHTVEVPGNSGESTNGHVIENTAGHSVSETAGFITLEENDSTPANSLKKNEAAEAGQGSGADFLFQPYHTVDYFASQGIKIREDDKPVDKFGKQLKSFTDWLKTMKRLPVSEVTKHIDRGTEHKVEMMAEHSIEDREVVTEAMAEVWEKQKNYEKAIAIYSKLSLLDPSKSAYFAAKIENLKKFN